MCFFSCSLFETIQTLFWAVFGLVDLDSFELEGIKIFTRFWGMLMFGTYSVINIVVLLNLLIAMMNHSYQLISVSLNHTKIHKYAAYKWLHAVAYTREKMRNDVDGKWKATHAHRHWNDEDDINGPMDIKPAHKHNINWSHLIKKNLLSSISVRGCLNYAIIASSVVHFLSLSLSCFAGREKTKKKM